MVSSPLLKSTLLSYGPEPRRADPETGRGREIEAGSRRRACSPSLKAESVTRFSSSA